MPGQFLLLSSCDTVATEHLAVSILLLQSMISDSMHRTAAPPPTRGHSFALGPSFSAASNSSVHFLLLLSRSLPPAVSSSSRQQLY